MKKESIDLGWHRFRFVEALPEMTILFSFQDSDPASREMAKGIVSMLPDTAGRTPKIKFGFCNGNIIERPCGSDFCEGVGMISAIASAVTMSECTASPGTYKIVAFKQSCSGADEYVCIEPPGIQGYGHATVNGTSYLHKNLLDLLVLIAGSGESNIYGPIHDSLFNYFNREFAQELEIMSGMSFQKAALIDTAMPAGSTDKANCAPHYSDFRRAMQGINDIVRQDGYYNENDRVAAFMSLLDDAADSYAELVNYGCEYSVEA
jgi:hypothetical protein